MNDLSSSWAARSIEVQNALLKVLLSGHWIHGPEHESFQSEFSEFLGVGYSLGVASGTDALEIAMRALGCKRGSKIITVANAGGYTSIAAKRIGCEIVQCDVDSKNLLISLESLGGLLSEQIDAVVVTHLFGNVAPINEVMEICHYFGVKVIEDCAQAVGAVRTIVNIALEVIAAVLPKCNCIPTKNAKALEIVIKITSKMYGPIKPKALIDSAALQKKSGSFISKISE